MDCYVNSIPEFLPFIIDAKLSAGLANVISDDIGAQEAMKATMN